MTSFVNLLPVEVRRRQLVLIRLRQWSAVWAAGMILVLGGFAYQRHELTAVESALYARRAEFLPLDNMQREIKQIQAQLSDMEQRESLALQLMKQQPVLLTIDALSKAARHCDGKVSIDHLTLQRKLSNDANRRPEPATVTVKGISIDHAAAAQFASELRNASRFHRVELKAAAPAIGTYAGAATYDIECVLQE